MSDYAESPKSIDLGSYFDEVHCRLVKESRFKDALDQLTSTRNLGEELLGRNDGAGNINMIIGQTFCKSDNHREAANAFARALEIFDETGNRTKTLESRSALVSEYIDTKEHEKAAKEWKTVLRTLQTDYPENMSLLAVAWKNLGTALRELGRDEGAIEWFDSCVKYYRDENMCEEAKYCEESLELMRKRAQDRKD